MQGLDFTWGTSLPLVVALMALLTMLAVSVPAAFKEGAALRDAQARGMFMDAIRNDVVRASKRRELMRVCKHVLIVTGIAISFVSLPPAKAAILRNYDFALIALFMLTNTLLDYRVKRRALRYLAERN